MIRDIRRAFGVPLLLCAALAASTVLFTAGGCGSDSKPVNPPPARAKPAPAPVAASGAGSTAAASTGLETFRGGLVESQAEIDRTLAALAALTDPNQQDVRGAYNTYCDQLARMNEHSQVMKREADAMRGSREEYFGKWEERVSEIDNPTIRASAEARRKRLRDAHEQIATASGEARDAYVPFMKDLQDIKKFLASDLSKGAIADLADASKKVQADGAIVEEKIAAVVRTLDTVQGG